MMPIGPWMIEHRLIDRLWLNSIQDISKKRISISSSLDLEHLVKYGGVFRGTEAGSRYRCRLSIEEEVAGWKEAA